MKTILSRIYRTNIKSSYIMSRNENKIPYRKNRFETSTLSNNTWKIQIFQEHGADPDNANLFLIIVRRREIELISDGNKLIEVKVI